MKCIICNEEIEIQKFPSGYEYKEGHNAYPVKEGRCCKKCNEEKVIPARLELRGRK